MQGGLSGSRAVTRGAHGSAALPATSAAISKTRAGNTAPPPISAAIKNTSGELITLIPLGIPIKLLKRVEELLMYFDFNNKLLGFSLDLKPQLGS